LQKGPRIADPKILTTSTFVPCPYHKDAAPGILSTVQWFPLNSMKGYVLQCRTI